MNANDSQEQVRGMTETNHTPAFVNNGGKNEGKLFGPRLFQNDRNTPFVAVLTGAEEGEVRVSPGEVPLQLLIYVGVGFLQVNDIKPREESSEAAPFPSSLLGVCEIKTTHRTMGVPRAGL